MRLFVLAPALVLVGVLVGCNQPAERLNAPPHGVAAQTGDLQNYYHMMIDNALLEDMTVSDVHFVPHRPLLTSLGEDRLSRLAWLLDRYGGTIRYYTDLDDDVLVEGRTDAIMAFLGEKGLDTRQHVLRRDLPGGAGLDAEQAIEIRKHEASYQPNRSSGGDAPQVAPIEGF